MSALIVITREVFKMKKLIRFMYFLICAMMLFSTYAFAYLDPSTMTYAIQVVAGVFIAAGAVVGIYWHKIKRFFRNKMKKG